MNTPILLCTSFYQYFKETKSQIALTTLKTPGHPDINMEMKIENDKITFSGESAIEVNPYRVYTVEFKKNSVTLTSLYSYDCPYSDMSCDSKSTLVLENNKITKSSEQTDQHTGPIAPENAEILIDFMVKIIEKITTKKNLESFIKQKENGKNMSYFFLNQAMQNANQLQSHPEHMAPSKVLDFLFNHQIASMAGMDKLTWADRAKQATLSDSFKNRKLMSPHPDAIESDVSDLPPPADDHLPPPPYEELDPPTYAPSPSWTGR